MKLEQSFTVDAPVGQVWEALIDVERIAPWNVPGRYGWVGGSGTSAHVDPVGHGITILLTTVALENPAPPAVMREFWAHSARVRS